MKKTQTAKKERPFDAAVKEVADFFIEALQKGTAPWQKPWVGGANRDAPRSGVTGKEYQGINSIFLDAIADVKHFEDPRWITFKQAQEMGGTVKKGQHGVKCFFYKEKKYVEDEDGKKRYILTPEQEKIEKDKGNKIEKLLIPCPFTVFNLTQCENINLPPIEPVKTEMTWTPVEKAERLLRNSGAVIEHKKQGSAYYSPSQDKIVLPIKEQFRSPEGYYDTALHELGHWTGHQSRLNRHLIGGFGTPAYAKEELRAEISSMMVSKEVGIPHDASQHASYVASWIKALKEDPKEIFRAATDAQKIKNYILDLDRKKAKEEEKTSEIVVAREEERKSAVKDFVQLPATAQAEVKEALQKSLLKVPEHNPYIDKVQKSINKGMER